MKHVRLIQSIIVAAAVVVVVSPAAFAGTATALAVSDTSTSAQTTAQTPPQKVTFADTATPGSITQELHVTARVAPMVRIVVDPTGAIKEITSNTDEPVVPQVFISNDALENKAELSPGIRKQFEQLMPGGVVKKGTFYHRSDSLAGVFSTTPALRLKNTP